LVANAKPGISTMGEPTRREISDGASGLWLVVQKSGHKSWAVRYRFKRRTRKLTLKSVTLADARVQAAQALREVAEGRDPGTKRARKKLASVVLDDKDLVEQRRHEQTRAALAILLALVIRDL
jgi:hypothetical protein